MSLTEKDVLKIAKLSRIRLDEKQVTYFQGELTNLLDWVNMLQEVNTDNVLELNSVSQKKLPLRKDEVTDGGISEQIVKNSAQADYGCFIVPKVVE